MSKEQFDKNIDFLARKAAENYSLPFTEEAWNKMEKLLNKEEKKKRPAIWWWSATAIVLLAGISYFLINTQNDKDTTSNNISENRNIENLTSNNIQKNNSTNSNSSEKKESVPGKETIENTTTTKLNNSINENSSVTEKSNPKAISNSNIGTNTKQNTSYKVATSLNKATKKGYTNNEIIAYNNYTKSSTIEEIQLDNYHKNKLAYNEFYNQSIATKNDLKFPKGSLSRNSYLPTIDSLIEQTAIVKKSTSSFINKLEVGLLAATDINSANFKHTDKISTDFGILLAYNLSKRMSISSGFAVSNKIYSADSNTYKNPSAPNSHYLITGIDAKCLVYEIPINFQYLLTENKKSSWLGIAGLSSYLMKKENYDYYYLYYGNPKKLTYEINNENNHFFSILNLAIAYRKKINNQFSYQIMPFSKIPLEGVGKGKVNLYTLGLAATFNYSIGKKK